MIVLSRARRNSLIAETENEKLKAKLAVQGQQIQELRVLRDKQRRRIRILEEKVSRPPSVKIAKTVLDKYLDENDVFPKRGKGKADAESVKSLFNRIPQHTEFKIAGGIKLDGKFQTFTILSREILTVVNLFCISE